MITGENFKRVNKNRTIEQLKDKLQKEKENLHYYLKLNDWVYDDKSVKLENQIKEIEYQIYCAEYEDNRKRNWN